MEGKIEYVNNEKGYGFIKVEGHDKNIFFHVKDLKGLSMDELQKGDSIVYEDIIDTPKGKAAKGISLQ